MESGRQARGPRGGGGRCGAGFLCRVMKLIKELLQVCKTTEPAQARAQLRTMRREVQTYPHPQAQIKTEKLQLPGEGFWA